MKILKTMLKQKAVYWPLLSNDSGGVRFDAFGQPQYASPIEIECRWEDGNEEYLDDKGQRFISRAVVYVDRDLEVGGLLMLGEMYSGMESNPKANQDVWEVKRFNKLPTLRAKHFLRSAIL